MKALQLLAHGTPGKFLITDLPDLLPAENEVVVRVKACGLNHLDLWTESGALPIPIKLPRILGGEIAGVIEKLGAKVTDWQIGDRVAIQSNLFCGQCEFCAQGDESQCLQSQLLGVNRDGGLAEQVAVPALSLVKLPASVDFVIAAALTLAGSTAMHMLTNRTQVQPGEWVLVMGGTSGVGSSAIQIARAHGGRVISTGRTAAKRETALRLGAEFIVDNSNTDWPAEVRKITNKRGVSLVIEHVGGKVLEQAFHCLARNGRIVTCGATAGQTIELNLWPFFVKQQRLIGSYGRNRSDLVATLRWASEGRLTPLIDRTVGLSDTVSTLVALRNSQISGKAVVEF